MNAVQDTLDRARLVRQMHEVPVQVRAVFSGYMGMPLEAVDFYFSLDNAFHDPDHPLIRASTVSMDGHNSKSFDWMHDDGFQLVGGRFRGTTTLGQCAWRTRNVKEFDPPFNKGRPKAGDVRQIYGVLGSSFFIYSHVTPDVRDGDFDSIVNIKVVIGATADDLKRYLEARIYPKIDDELLKRIRKKAGVALDLGFEKLSMPKDLKSSRKIAKP